MATSTLLLSTFAVVLLFSLLPGGYSWRATLHRDSDFRGGHIELSGNGCRGIPGDFNDRTSSVNTHGGCIRLYQNSGCTGKSLELFPGSGSHNNLKAHGFNDKASSVGNCPRGKRDVHDGYSSSFSSHSGME
ncbi:uncharacterized protein LOC103524398 [Diaphorina citri]|uniref:Uncharacterized protein LOC103524398 n=1 Tax=Diaphorina citri TaxID=121845 RepID=A0A1S3DTJ3_DIACI|nr:uncharacterized protein LOC103524398 [Diaphorina citri]